MLPYDDWLDKAELLAEGRKRRVSHNCGPGRVMLISHSADGYSAWCFRCNDKGFKAHGLRTLDQLAAAKEARRYAYTKQQGSIQLPADFTFEIPTFARLWYYRAGCTDQLARMYGIGWSPSQHRVVIPVRCPSSGVLVYAQSRAVRGEQPKYLNCAAAGRQGIFFTSDPRTIGYYSRAVHQPGTQGACVPGSRIVLGEDILSAIRIGLSTQAGAILGTSLDDATAASLCQYERITFWLDGDKAGVKGRLRGMQTLRLMHPGTVDYIKSPDDPKSYSQAEIEEYLR